jgi:Na+-translocating ferredoxin:NAD+ oxidoreductase RNF subunit RnfB
MEISMSVVVQALIGAAAGAFGAYVAIRSDLAELKAKVTRIDQILNK